ncbi:MAG: hypothetical protein Q8S21_00915 [Candidatus Paracaedibacteraceae bacterium]|nr:hypothetical protein [Candidatus Paracaedibacteraceae bacterium]
MDEPIEGISVSQLHHAAHEVNQLSAPKMGTMDVVATELQHFTCKVDQPLTAELDAMQEATESDHFEHEADHSLTLELEAMEESTESDHSEHGVVRSLIVKTSVTNEVNASHHKEHKHGPSGEKCLGLFDITKQKGKKKWNSICDDRAPNKQI